MNQSFPMFCLVYKSKALASIGNQEVKDILVTARRFNKKNNITGCLLFYGGRFLQYLEGSQVTILELFDRIKIDERHTEVELLNHGKINSREFENWEMAYENLNGENSQLQYLKVLTASFFEDFENRLEPNPASQQFWSTAKKMLQTKEQLS